MYLQVCAIFLRRNALIDMTWLASHHPIILTFSLWKSNRTMARRWPWPLTTSIYIRSTPRSPKTRPLGLMFWTCEDRGPAPTLELWKHRPVKSFFVHDVMGCTSGRPYWSIADGQWPLVTQSCAHRLLVLTGCGQTDSRLVVPTFEWNERLSGNRR